MCIIMGLKHETEIFLSWERELFYLKEPHSFSKLSRPQMHQFNNYRILAEVPSDPASELHSLHWICPILRLKIASSMNWTESDSLIGHDCEHDCKRTTLPWPPGLTALTDLSPSAGCLNLL